MNTILMLTLANIFSLLTYQSQHSYVEETFINARFDYNTIYAQNGTAGYNCFFPVSKKQENDFSVIIHLEYTMGVGGAVYPTYRPYILFANGKIYSNPVVPVSDMDIAASQMKEPKKWGTWEKNNNNIHVHWPKAKPKDQDKDWSPKSYFKVKGGIKGEKIEGNFKTIDGIGNTFLGGEVTVVAAKTISFSKSGKFTLISVGGETSSDIWEIHYGKANESGTYTIDGYSIELLFNTGKKERHLFYFYPDSKDHFGIASSIYIPLKQ